MQTSRPVHHPRPRLAGPIVRLVPALWAAAIRLALAAALGLGAAAAPVAALPAADMVGLNGAPCSYATLGAALAAAGPGDTVYIAPGTYNEVLGTLDKDLHLTAATADCTEADLDAPFIDYDIDGGGAVGVNGGLAYIAPGRTITLTNLNLINAQAVYGGIVYVDEDATVTFDHVRLAEGQANGSGGLLYVAEGASAALVNGSVLIDGTAGTSGGALYLEGEVLLSGSYIADSHAASGGGVAMDGEALLRMLHGNLGLLGPNTAGSGGGIYMTGQSRLEMLGHSYISRNQATVSQGGGIYASGDVSVEMVDSSRVFDNDAATDGGGIYAAAGAAVILAERSTVGGPLLPNANTAGRGGGLFADGAAYVLIQDSAVVQHNSAGEGGGVYLAGGTPLTMTGGAVLSNTAAGWGGGFVIDVGSAYLAEAVVAGNDAAAGGGMVIDGNANNFLTAVNSQIVSNTAATDGGGLYVQNASVLISDTNGTSRLAANTAGGNGGGLWKSGGSGGLQLRAEVPGSQVLMEGNTANGSGGGLYSENGSDVYVVGGVVITGNIALADGGGWHQSGGSLLAVGAGPGLRPYIAGNMALNGHGGGLYLSDVSSGPGVPSHLSDLDIAGNQADQDGGGLHLSDGTRVLMLNGRVHGNLAGLDGGGVLLSDAELAVGGLGESCQNANQPANHYCSELRGNAANNGGAFRVEAAARLEISSTAVISNSASLGGGVMSASNGDQVEITNSLFTGNAGTAIYVAADGSLEVVHATLAGNPSWAIDVNDNGASFDLFNSIVWGNGSGVESAVAVGGGCSISQNGVGGANTDPLFKTTGRGDYRLQSGSPAVDACTDGTDADLDSLPRPQDGDYDMGAFEAGMPLVLFSAYNPVAEGHAGLTPAPLVVSLSETTAQTVTLGVEAVAGTAAPGQDYNALSQPLVFAPGTLSQTVTLQVIGDTVYEGDETVSLELSSDGNAALTATAAEFEIVNDDALPVLNPTSVEVVEGDGGSKPVTVTVNLSHASAFTVTVDYVTDDVPNLDENRATAGADYEPASGTLVFAPGTTSARLILNIIGDDLAEGDETLEIAFYNVIGAVIPPDELPDIVVTILDDDGVVQLFLPLIVRN